MCPAYDIILEEMRENFSNHKKVIEIFTDISGSESKFTVRINHRQVSIEKNNNEELRCNWYTVFLHSALHNWGTCYCMQ
jgi:deoxyadenosine/deoxycytidine kinase